MDMGALLKQAKKMQKDLAKTEAELKEKLYTASVGGGVVKVEVSGKNEFKRLIISTQQNLYIYFSSNFQFLLTHLLSLFEVIQFPP